MRDHSLACACVVLWVAGPLSSCATSERGYHEVMSATGPVAGDAARLIFVRPRHRDDGPGGAGAVIRVNGHPAGVVRYGGFFYLDVTPGPVMLIASGPHAVFGACESRLEVSAGSTTYFDIGPRLSYMVAGALGAVVGGAAAATALPDVYGSATGAATAIGTGVAAGDALGTAAGVGLESRNRSCGGPFRVMPMTEPAARSALETSVWSK